MEHSARGATHWERLEALFHRALDLPDATRESKAREWCGEEPDLLSDLLEMIAANASVVERIASNPLTPPASVAVLVRPSESQSEADPWLGRVLGAFELERELGHGGMGVVYLGRRISGGFTQQVAIKLIARHLNSAPAVHQFNLERDTLARLEHKNIASLIDAGVTPEGTPFVAMEYIEGRPLDKACDRAALSLQDKVQLVLQLCEAVAYVHRNLILHRDLKPSNVIVNSEGTVKLLDFGTLKLLGPAAHLSSEMTQAGMRAITLRYASPEHIGDRTLSTASDVYSLGMILYRILAGRLPEGLSELSASEYLLRLECVAIAPPPLEPGSDRELASDLSAITMKAIRFEASARYESVDQFAADLRRALEQRPVSARQGTIRYRLRRFVRRNRILLVGSVATLMVLATGVAAMLYESSIAHAQSRRADAGVEVERRLTHTLLFDYFDQLKRIPASTDAQRRAVSQALPYLDRLNQSYVSPALRLDSIRAYTSLGLLQGSIYEQNLGDAPGAIVTLRKAVTLAAQLRDSDPRNEIYLGSYISAERALGQVYFGAGNATEALRHLQAAADAGQLMIAMPDVSPEMVTEIASSSDLLGDTYGLPSAGTLNDPVKARERYQQAQDVYRSGLHLHPDCIVCRRGAAVEDWKLGMGAQDTADAEPFYRDALASIAALPVSEQHTPRVRRMDTIIRQSLGLALMDDGNPRDGLALVLAAQQSFRATVAADPLDNRARADLALLNSSLANGFDDMGRSQEELAANQEFLADVNAILRKDPTNTIWQFRRSIALARWGTLLMKAGNKDEGLRHGAESLAIVLPLAQKPDAGPRILDLASSSLVHFSPAPGHDGPLAVSFARRAIGDAQHATTEQLVILAEAQRFAGAGNDAMLSAQAAIKSLPPHLVGLSDKAWHARALHVLQQATAHPQH